MAGQGGLALSEALSDLDSTHRLTDSSSDFSHAAPPKREAKGLLGRRKVCYI